MSCSNSTWKETCEDFSFAFERDIRKQKQWSSPSPLSPLMPCVSTQSTSSTLRHCPNPPNAIAPNKRCHFEGDNFTSREIPTFHPKRRFSEDSGISSCGSSASSVADDVESSPGFIQKTKVRTSRLHSYHGVPSSCSSFQSCTVAAVLAAGVSSDSEETDDSASEEGSDSVFAEDSINCRVNFPCKQSSLSGNDSSMASQIRHFLQNIEYSDTDDSISRKGKTHLGRDILDLGANVRTKFPLQASVLPDMNVPLFLQNRSQYHRLGKFGTTETFLLANCVKKCGFSFPVPPHQKSLN